MTNLEEEMDLAEEEIEKIQIREVRIEEEEDKAWKMIARTRAAIEKEAKKSPPTSPSPGETPEAMETQVVKKEKDTPSHTLTENPMKLPKITIPIFSGQKNEFERFWNIYSLMVEKTQLPAAAKMSILLSHLEGKAKTRLGGLELKEEDYHQAKEIIKSRYEAPEKQTKSLHTRFSVLDARQGNTEDQEIVVDQLKQIIRKMKVTKEENIDNEQMNREIINKFNPQTQKTIIKMKARQEKETPWKTETLLEKVQNIT